MKAKKKVIKKSSPISATKAKAIEAGKKQLEEFKETVKDYGELPQYKKQGRPTKYEPEMDNAVIEFLSMGLSKDACAGFLGITKDTLYRWQKENKSFSDAIKKGVELSRLFWELKGLKHLTHSMKGTQLNSTVWIFNMKNRFKWTDRHEIELGEETNKTFNFKLDINPDVLDAEPEEI